MPHFKKVRFAAPLLFSLSIFNCNSGGVTSSNQYPPSNLAYSHATAIYAVDSIITPDTPTVTGTVIRYSVSPALPYGLSLNDSSGVISGRPFTTSPPTQYTVTAINSWGTTSFTLTLTVTTAALISLSYPTPVFYVSGVAVADTPVVLGTVTNYSVSPALPASLSLNTSTGVISGTPAGISVAANYTITASNNLGSTTAVVKIAVYNTPPSNLSYPYTPVIYLGGIAIDNLIPAATGSVTHYSVLPVLPSGLSLNDTTGVISGIPAGTSSATNYTVTASNSLGSTTAAINIAVNWMIRSPGTRNNLRSVIWTGSRLVTVGDSGIILTSADGKVWTVRSSGTTNILSCVAWTGSQLVAVGNGGTILTSPDGVVWTARNSGSTKTLNSTIWTGTQLIVVGNAGTIITSPDGINFTVRTSGTIYDMHSVTWTGSQFVAGGDSASGTINNMLTSPNGTIWMVRALDAFTNLNSLTWTGNQLVGCGWTGIYTSQNGLTWIQSSGTPDVKVVTWTGGQLLGIGYSAIYSSPDGTVWTARNLGRDYFSYQTASATAMGNQLVAVGIYGTILTSF